MNTNLNPFAGRNSGRYTHAGMPVDILQMDYEMRAFAELYVARRPHSVLEIGTRWGGTLWHWLTFGALPDAGWRTVVAVDQHFESAQDVMQGWANNAGAELFLIEGDSTSAETIAQVTQRLPNGVDWLFIDGDHSYNGVLADFNNYAPLLNKGGVLALHDINPQAEAQVDRLWQQIQRTGATTREIIADPNSQGSGIGIVFA